MQGEDRLIEYDTTDNGNHAHAVLRRPYEDFGDDLLLAAHYERAATTSARLARCPISP